MPENALARIEADMAKRNARLGRLRLLLAGLLAGILAMLAASWIVTQTLRDREATQRDSRAAATKRINALTQQITVLQTELADARDVAGQLAAQKAALIRQLALAGIRPVVPSTAPIPDNPSKTRTGATPSPAPSPGARPAPAPAPKPTSKPAPKPAPKPSPTPKPRPTLPGPVPGIPIPTLPPLPLLSKES